MTRFEITFAWFGLRGSSASRLSAASTAKAAAPDNPQAPAARGSGNPRSSRPSRKRISRSGRITSIPASVFPANSSPAPRPVESARRRVPSCRSSLKSSAIVWERYSSAIPTRPGKKRKRKPGPSGAAAVSSRRTETAGGNRYVPARSASRRISTAIPATSTSAGEARSVSVAPRTRPSGPPRRSRSPLPPSASAAVISSTIVGRIRCEGFFSSRRVDVRPSR